MPPKGRKGSGRGGQSPKLKDDEEVPVDDTINVTHNARVAAAIKTITDHAVFKDIAKAKPLGHGQKDKICKLQGFKDAFDPQKTNSTLCSSGQAEFGGNF